MSLFVEIEKNLGKIQLDVKFETESSTFALLGASGCGKSMTLKCIAGIEKPDSGKIILNGVTLFDSEKHINLPPQKRHVGYLFQQYALFPNMTVRQNIMAGARSRPKAEAERLTDEKIAALHLGGLEDKRPNQLSGGQQQRVALARILVNDPGALLLDEPFSALDTYLRWELELELADTLAKFGKPVVFVSHSREEVVRLCEDVCVITEGKSEGTQKVRDLFSRPRTRSACLLAGCKNITRIRPMEDGKVMAEDWGAVLDTGRKEPESFAFLGVKSRNLRIAQSPGVNTVECTVARLVEDERRFTVIMRTDTGAILNMTTDYAHGAVLNPGDRLFIHIDPSNFLMLRE